MVDETGQARTESVGECAVRQEHIAEKRTREGLELAKKIYL